MSIFHLGGDLEKGKIVKVSKGFAKVGLKQRQRGHQHFHEASLLGRHVAMGMRSKDEP
jgi:hypothetical protein